MIRTVYVHQSIKLISTDPFRQCVKVHPIMQIGVFRIMMYLDILRMSGNLICGMYKIQVTIQSPSVNITGRGAKAATTSGKLNLRQNHVSDDG